MTQVLSQKEVNELKQKRKIHKTFLISKTKRVRHSVANRHMHFVQSGNEKTPKVFYLVQLSEFLQCFVCDCGDFTYNCLPGDLCVHIMAASFHLEGEY